MKETSTSISDNSKRPVLDLKIWPHRSCSKKNFRIIFGFLALGLLAPPMLFVNLNMTIHILPFSLAALILFYFFCKKNFLDGNLTETLKIFPRNIILHRSEPSGKVKTWSANPFWTRVNLYENGPVEKYLTLKEKGIEVELGAFLTPQEREDLKNLIDKTLAKLKIND